MDLGRYSLGLSRNKTGNAAQPANTTTPSAPPPPPPPTAQPAQSAQPAATFAHSPYASQRGSRVPSPQRPLPPCRDQAPSDGPSPTMMGTSRQVTEPQPTWADMKTKAGKDRKRLPLACVACRRKKIRCSGEQPTCRSCSRQSTVCVYRQSSTTRKAGPRTDYMAMLDKRLKRMEERVIKIIPKDELPTVPRMPRAVVKPASLLEQAASSSTRKRSAYEAFDGDLDGWAASKPAAASRTGARNGSQSTVKTAPSDESSLLTEGLEHLPTRMIQQHLTEVYFSYVYGQSYHLLHKPSMMRKLATDSVPPVLLLAICAVSARFSTHPQLTSEPSFRRGEAWAEAALAIAMRRFDSPNITIITALLLLGLHEFGTCRGGRSWMLGGMALRMAYALQLHRDLPEDPSKSDSVAELSFTDREIRRRVMWGCFMMDRFNSSGTQRPMYAAEADMHIQLPVKEQFFIQGIAAKTEPLHLPAASTHPTDIEGMTGAADTRTENVGVSAYIVRVVALYGRLVQYLNLGGMEADPHMGVDGDHGHRRLRLEVDRFGQELPESLQFTEDNLRVHVAEDVGNQFLYLHIAYQQCIIFIHRFAFAHIRRGPIPKTTTPWMLQQARFRANKSAALISSYLERAVECRVVAPFTGYCAYVASAVHIKMAFSADPTLAASAKEDLKRNLRFLSHMKNYWGNLHFLLESLRDMWRQFADSAGKAGGGTAPLVFQYGDWYDQYPQGVTTLRFDEPITAPKKEPGADAAMAQKAVVQNFEQYSATLSPGPKDRPSSRETGRQTAEPMAKVPKRSATQEECRHSGQGDVAAQAGLGLESVSLSSRPTFPESYDRARPPPVVTAQMMDGGSGGMASSFLPPPPQTELFYGGAMPGAHAPVALPDYGAMNQGAIGLAPDMGNYLWDLDFNNIVTDDFLTEEQGWFMPFNLEPPYVDATGAMFLDSAI